MSIESGSPLMLSPSRLFCLLALLLLTAGANIGAAAASEQVFHVTGSTQRVCQLTGISRY
jgi:hypothetical protein